MSDILLVLILIVLCIIAYFVFAIGRNLYKDK